MWLKCVLPVSRRSLLIVFRAATPNSSSRYTVPSALSLLRFSSTQAADPGSERETPTFVNVQQTGHSFSPDVKAGDIVRCPLELIVGKSWQTLWMTLVFNPVASQTSAFFAKNIGFDHLPLPHNLHLLLTLGMGVPKMAEYARTHLAISNVTQELPLFPGETVHAYFRVNTIQPAPTQGIVMDTTHVLLNSSDRVTFSVDKVTHFPYLRERTDLAEKLVSRRPSKTYDRIIRTPIENLISWEVQPSLEPGEVYVHRLVRTFLPTDQIYLCNLLRISNDLHVNFLTHSAKSIVLVSPFAMAAVISNTLQDLGDPLWETVVSCRHFHSVHVGDTVLSVTMIDNVKSLDANQDLEEVTVTSLGLLNIDEKLVAEHGLPNFLFEEKLNTVDDLEKVCSLFSPHLMQKVALRLKRRFVRVQPDVLQRLQQLEGAEEKRAVKKNKWFG